jgi:hypothetical protein
LSIDINASTSRQSRRWRLSWSTAHSLFIDALQSVTTCRIYRVFKPLVVCPILRHRTKGELLRVWRMQKTALVLAVPDT